jgi:hypothetical protein
VAASVYLRDGGLELFYVRQHEVGALMHGDGLPAGVVRRSLPEMLFNVLLDQRVREGPAASASASASAEAEDLHPEMPDYIYGVADLIRARQAFCSRSVSQRAS